MKKKIEIIENNKKVEKEINYIPFRYILSLLLILFEYLAVIAIVSIITIYVPYFYIAVVLTQLGCAVAIINSEDNPDYKVPWLFIVMLVPIIGFMTYFMFYKREFSKKEIKKIKKIHQARTKDDSVELSNCNKTSLSAFLQAKGLIKLSNSHLYQNTDIQYFPSGEKMFESLLQDLKTAKEFIFIDFFIIEDGLFWNSILEILKQKVQENVEVKLVYDDIGCMSKLPGDFYKILQKMGIDATPFNKLKGQANNKFNNRSHRKILVIDGKIAYTGGINLADEYINHIQKFGYWKDVAIKLEGEAVNEMTRLFLIDFSLDNKKKVEFEKYYKNYKKDNLGFCIPFGDGPKPIFERQVSKTLLMNMLGQAKKYFYITTPYLIIDNELTTALINAAIRGIDVKIITPHIPDKKFVFMMTRNSYHKLMNAGIQIYEYEPGFIHAKTYLCDDEYAIIGTINLDYRSLVHHFENGVWIYNHQVISDIKNDFETTLSHSIPIKNSMLKENFIIKFIKSIIGIFSSLL